jgi:hypothetical protein
MDLVEGITVRTAVNDGVRVLRDSMGRVINSSNSDTYGGAKCIHD